MKAIITYGCMGGDEGKGSIVDFLASELKNSIVIRYSGGFQCGHNVVLPEGRSHCFSQFGSGTLAGARTYIDRDVLIEPIAMYNEAQALSKFGIDPYDLIRVNPNCAITTKYHKLINRAMSGGSCGLGIGATRYTSLNGMSIKIGDTFDTIVTKLFRIRELLEDWFFQKNNGSIDKLSNTGYNRLSIYKVAQEIHNYSRPIKTSYFDLDYDYAIFEGAQGMALNEYTGFRPEESTWGNVSPRNALELCHRHEIPYHVLGITRTYITRHGGELPFEEFEYNDKFNPENPYQGKMKFYKMNKEYFDRFYNQVNPDSLAVNCIDEFGDMDLRDYKVNIKGYGPYRDHKVLVKKVEDWNYEIK